MNNIRAEEEQRLKAISEGEKAVTRHEEKIAELAPGEEPDREAIVRWPGVSPSDVAESPQSGEAAAVRRDGHCPGRAEGGRLDDAAGSQRD